MSKSTYFTGQPVYSQVIKLLDKAKIQQISQETLGSERYVKRLTGWKHLIIMLFGILKHFDSLQELEIGMKAETMKLSHLGLDYVVRRSTLSEVLLSAKLQNATISLSAMPINRRCGLLFGKVSPPFRLSFIGCPLKRENGRHEMWPNVFFKPLRALEYGEFY